VSLFRSYNFRHYSQHGDNRCLESQRHEKRETVRSHDLSQKYNDHHQATQMEGTVHAHGHCSNHDRMQQIRAVGDATEGIEDRRRQNRVGET
jgi:hypothetical protein